MDGQRGRAVIQNAGAVAWWACSGQCVDTCAGGARGSVGGGVGGSRHGLYTGNGMSGGLRDGSSSFMNSLVVRPSA